MRPIDAADQLPTKPNLSGLMYPVVTLDPSYRPRRLAQAAADLADARPSALCELSPEKQVTEGLSPVILLHAADDKTVPVENSNRHVHGAESQGRADRDAHLRGRRPRLRPALHDRTNPLRPGPALFETFAKRHGL
jgi:hypothetical protein